MTKNVTSFLKGICKIGKPLLNVSLDKLVKLIKKGHLCEIAKAIVKVSN